MMTTGWIAFGDLHGKIQIRVSELLARLSICLTFVYVHVLMTLPMLYAECLPDEVDAVPGTFLS